MHIATFYIPYIHCILAIKYYRFYCFRSEMGIVCVYVCVSSYGHVYAPPTVVPPSPVSASTPDPSDPCSSYSVLNATWRATTNRDANPLRCDSDVQWQGWYLLVHGEHSVRMAESCVPTYSCGTAAPLWLHGSHPTPEDGIVTRQVCSAMMFVKAESFEPLLDVNDGKRVTPVELIFSFLFLFALSMWP